MKNCLILVVLISFFSCKKESNTSTEKFKVLNYLEKIMEKEGIPGLQVTVIKNNKIILSENLGIANVPFSVAVKENTIFSINSIAKVFASTAILQLEERNKLVLSDSISKHISNLPNKWRSITIRQLLSHTSGLPDIEDPYKDELIGGKGQDSAWVAVQKMPLQFKSGEEFNYNATNYLLIQKIIEKHGNVPFEEFVKTNQFDVAGMKQTIYGNSFDVKENKSPTYCYYYKDKTTGEYIKGTNLIEVNEEFPSNLRADAGVFTTANEMAKWIISLQSGKLLQKASIDKMWTPVKLNNGKYGDFTGILNTYALGWPVIKREKHLGVSPFGGGRASFTIYPKDNLSIILFTNLSGIPTYEMVDQISKFYF
ncbi:serine hydrolase domain-containing protein [Aquimarina aquimarini]|uniref:serine hydrolase domain-containing protein n=1 Tax=Aquimarina aquimarini TaxID=1191734 RepID=UPI000D5605E8|nr:serine hydrolase domain-containing protein [Aquimarina aquimarini]